MVHQQGLLPYATAVIVTGELRSAAYLVDRADQDLRDSDLTALAATCLLKAHDPHAARDRLERGARAHGWDASTRYLRAVAVAGTGRVAEAIEAAQEAARDPSSRVDAQRLLVGLQLENGEIDAARATAAIVAGLERHTVDTQLMLAHVAEHEGKTADRVLALEAALGREPENPTVRTALGQAYLDAGRRSEGQRELGAVVAADPGHPTAAQALLGSTIRSRRGRLGLFVVFWIPAVLALAVGSLAEVLGHSGGWGVIVYVGSLAGVCVGLRLFERRRTDPAVRRIRAEAHRRMRQASQPPIGGWAPWSLIVIGILAVLIGSAALFVPSPERDPVLGLVGIIAFGAFLAMIGLWLLPLTRKHRAQTHPRRMDPRSCHCTEVTRLVGRMAHGYAKHHLIHPVVLTDDGIERRRCELLGTAWILFPQHAGPPKEQLPLLLRLPYDPASMAVDHDGPGMGFYL